MTRARLVGLLNVPGLQRLALFAMAGAGAASAQSLPASELRAQALDLDQAAWSIEGRNDNRADGLTLYAGSLAQDMWLRDIWVQLDDEPLQSYTYSQREAEALRAQGLHVLISSTLTPGKHRLRAQAAAAGLDAGPSDARRRSAIDVTLTKTAAPMELELDWTPGGMTSSASLRLKEWQRGAPAPAANSYRPGDEEDPRLHAIDFLAATGRSFLAQSVWRQLSAEIPGLKVRAGSVVSEAAAPALYASYNEAVAQGGVPAGLDKLGSSGDCDNKPSLLCDRLNTALGYRLLDQSEGEGAAAAFRRVRAPGPYASSALLGLGWALLTPLHASASAAAAKPPSAFAHREPRLMKGKERDASLRASLVPWIELLGRDPTDPAVQEAQIAVAWALNEQDAQLQAQDYYNRAIDLLEDVLARTEKARAEIAAHKLTALIVAGSAGEAWHWGLADRLPDPRWWVFPINKAAPEAFYLERLLGQAAFRDTLLRLRDAHEIDSAMLAHRAALAALADPAAAELLTRIDALRPQLAAVIDAECQQVEQLALASLDELKRQTQGNLVEARYELARMYDRPPEVAAK